MSLSMRQSIISLNILNLYLIQSNNEYSDQTRTGVFHMIWLCNPKFKINRMCKNNLIICFSHRTNTEIFLKNMRRPGIEPGSTAWKAAMLTTIPPTHFLYLMTFQVVTANTMAETGREPPLYK